ncbi:MAG TPA: phosphoribosyltransferase family protein [Nitrososphaerales archaeon]|nr:phosphoribosyltransferase family protein [Nitrososphaerales archaeon]
MQLVFQDRTEAAKKLAERLEWLRKEEPLILAIPRGGVVTGDVIATALGAKLDVVVPRKLGSPYNPELAIGAVMHDATHFLNSDIIDMLNVPKEYIDAEIASQIKEIERRLVKFRGSKKYDLQDKTIVVVDDGIATGATMFAAVQWVKKQKPRKLIVAVPVGPTQTIDRLKKVADEVIVVATPLLFGAVGEFYQDFTQVTDDKVQEIMRKHGYKI